jgi:hypothetical protein
MDGGKPPKLVCREETKTDARSARDVLKQLDATGRDSAKR